MLVSSVALRWHRRRHPRHGRMPQHLSNKSSALSRVTLHYALPIHCRHCDDPVSLIKHLQYMSDITSEHSAAAAQQHALRQCIVSHTDAVVAPASVLTHRNRRGFVQQILATCTNTVPVLSTQQNHFLLLRQRSFSKFSFYCILVFVCCVWQDLLFFNYFLDLRF